MYKIEIRPAAQRDIKKLTPNIQIQVLNAIRSLADEPRPEGTKKLKGYRNRYRVRVNEYRILYEVLDDKIIVIIVRVRHRKDVYRK